MAKMRRTPDDKTPVAKMIVGLGWKGISMPINQINAEGIQHGINLVAEEAGVTQNQTAANTSEDIIQEGVDRVAEEAGVSTGQTAAATEDAIAAAAAGAVFSAGFVPSLDLPPEYTASEWDNWADFYTNGAANVEYWTDLVTESVIGCESMYFYADLPHPGISSNGGWEFLVRYMDGTYSNGGVWTALDSWSGADYVRGTCSTGIYWVVLLTAKGSAAGDKIHSYGLRWIDFDPGSDVVQGSMSDSYATYLVR